MSDKDILKIENKENQFVFSIYKTNGKTEVNIGVGGGDNITMSIWQFFTFVQLVNSLYDMYIKIKDFSK